MRVTETPGRVIATLSAIHWVYLLLHLVLLVVGILMVMLGGTLLVAVGTSVIAAALAGWVLFLHAWLSQEEFRRLNILREFGLTEAFDHRSVRIKQEYDVRLRSAEEGIDIMGFGLRNLREDYRKEFEAWAGRAKVRVLLIDPEFFSTRQPLANQRDKEEGETVGTIVKDVRAFVRDCSGLLRASEGRFQVRLYRCLPSVNIFRIDGNLFWGPYLVGGASKNLPTFLVGKRGILYERLSAHFNTIWADDDLSRPVPSEWLAKDA